MKHCIDWRQVAGSVLLIGLLAIGSAACGDDSDDDTPIAGTSAAGTGTSGAGAGGGGGMGGGGGGTSGGGAGTGGGGGGGAMSVMCMPPSGAVTCQPVMSAQGALPACCDAMEMNACGATVGMAGECVATGQAGTEDASCPSAMSIIGTNVPGCCKPSGMCGLMSGTLMGCIERSRYPLAFLMGMPTMPLASQACGGDTDGGI